MHYGDCRWPDIESLDKDRVAVVVPIASLEQHGHHLPLLTDTYLATAVAERVHERLGERVLLTPTLWLGASDHHLDFPGTISVPNSLYIEMIKSVVRSLVRAGFRRIFLLNGHGGNVAPGETAITELANSCDRCDEALVALGSYWAIAAAAMKPDSHGMTQQQLTHACEYETSMMLALHGRLVKMGAARGHTKPAISAVPGVRLAGRFHRMTGTGALDTPELATAEKGESLLAAITGEVAAFVEQMLQWPQREVLKPK
ncbi:MAG: creatininase family protein [Planctomycetes bacterium]|nr:creatininase family protein [Planctomycetota bacterium]